MDEILLIDKPAGWTSFDVVAKIRGKIRAEYTAKGEKPTKRQLRVGHAGTLDPFATGLLIILLGDACKKAGEFLKLDKTYEFTAKLGEVSTTGDPEGGITPYGVMSSKNQEVSSKEDFVIPAACPPKPFSIAKATAGRWRRGKAGIQSGKFERRESVSIPDSKFQPPTSSEVLQVLKSLTGEITQTPPAFSAIKIDGQRAYKLAREGKQVEIPSRQVKISRLELLSYEYPYIKCVCDVSSGTYIRSLVEDIGKALNTGAYCTQLRRTRIDNFQIEKAQNIDKVI